VLELVDKCNIIKTLLIKEICSWLPSWLNGQEIRSLYGKGHSRSLVSFDRPRVISY